MFYFVVFLRLKIHQNNFFDNRTESEKKKPAPASVILSFYWKKKLDKFCQFRDTNIRSQELLFVKCYSLFKSP